MTESAPGTDGRGRRAYLDHASTSPLRPAVFEAMVSHLRAAPGDPGRVHSEGHAARVAVEEARARVAALVGARPREVIFTSSGTEAVNTAIHGAVARARVEHTAAESGVHVVTTAVEHSSVLDACERSGSVVEVVPVDGHGRFDAGEVLGRLRDDTTFVSVQLANHEVGTLQPVAEIAAGCRERGVLCHVDACAGVGYVPLDFRELGADLVSLTAHKMGGPQGVGALLVRRGLRIPPLIVGGAQERARRAGIENVPAIVGFGAVAEEVTTSGDHEWSRMRALCERLVTGALATVEGLTLYGDPEWSGRLPNLACFGVDGVEAEPVLLGLDRAGVAVHSGSSCSSETLEPSPVLAAMGVDAEHSLRTSVGWSSTEDDVDAFLSSLPRVVTDLRALRA